MSAIPQAWESQISTITKTQKTGKIMSLPEPKWPATLTHKAWKQAKEQAEKKDKEIKFPESGTGKALDKALAEYKKIPWKTFITQGENLMANVGLQNMFTDHAKYVIPLVKALDQLLMALKNAKMPKLNFVAEFRKETEQFKEEIALDGAFFKSIKVQYADNETYKEKEEKEVRAKLEAAANGLKKYSMAQVAKDTRLRLGFLTYLESIHAEESFKFLIDYYNGGKNKDLYDTYIAKGAKLELNIDYKVAVVLTKCLPKYEDMNFAPVEKAVLELLKSNDSWPSFVKAWLRDQYIRKGLAQK